MSATKSKLKVDAIRELLLQRIKNGFYKAGDRLPIESELAIEFSASRGTVSKALSSLIHLGLVERKPRVGSRVLSAHASTDAKGTDVDTLAFIYPGEHHPAIWAIIGGFNEAAQISKKRTLLLSAGSDFEKESEMLGRLSDFRVKAVAVYPLIVNLEQRHRLEKALLDCPCPVVLVEIFLPWLNIPAVMADAFDAGYMMTKYMAQKGCKTIGFLSNDALCMSVRDFYMGYRKALRDCGVEENDRYVLQAPELKPDFDHPLEFGSMLARQWMTQAQPLPDGVLCSNDYIAQGCMKVAREMDVSIPEDLRVAALGGYAPRDPSCGGLQLTSSRVACEEIGKETFCRLNSLASGEKLDNADLYMYIKGTLVPGETV